MSTQNHDETLTAAASATPTQTPEGLSAASTAAVAVATHPLAAAPVQGPPASVDGFVKEFLRELNFGQGVSLSKSTVNDQYLALSRTVRHYLMARWIETQRLAG